MGRPSNTQTTTQKLDPFMQERIEDLYTRGTDYVESTPYEAFPGGSRVAGMSPMQMQAQDFLSQTFGNGTGTGVSQTYDAINAVRNSMGGAAPQVNPMQVGSGNLMQGISMYQDPYQNQVIDSAMSDIDRSRQLATQDVRSQATQAGAFGGDRAAILEAETNRGFADVSARTAAQLRSQGFDRAAGLAQSDAARGLQAGMANQGAGLSADIANQSAFFTGRGQQMQGAGLLSQFGGDIYNRNLGTADALSRMGAQQQNQSQAELSDQVNQWAEERGYGAQQIQFLQSLLSGMPFGQTQTTTGPGGSRGAGALGGAATGAGAGFLAGGPLGAGIGAGIGGLLGLF